MSKTAPPSTSQSGPIMAFFERCSEWATRFVSSHWGTLTAVLFLIIGICVFPWHEGEPISGILEKFMTMLSLVLLFLLQRAQSKDTKTLQLKLNELIATHEPASDRMINIEDLTEDQIDRLQQQFRNTDKS